MASLLELSINANNSTRAIKHNMTEASEITGLVGVAIAVEEVGSVSCSEITKRARFLHPDFGFHCQVKTSGATAIGRTRSAAFIADSAAARWLSRANVTSRINSGSTGSRIWTSASFIVGVLSGMS